MVLVITTAAAADRGGGILHLRSSVARAALRGRGRIFADDLSSTGPFPLPLASCPVTSARRCRALWNVRFVLTHFPIVSARSKGAPARVHFATGNFPIAP